MSKLIVMAVSIFGWGMGAYGLISPKAMVRFESTWQIKSGLWAASAIRLAFGIALWVAADRLQSPAVFKALSVVSVVSAIILALIGVSRFQSPLAWSTVAVLMGVFLIWSAAA